MSGQTDTAKNDATKLLILAITDPMVSQMEVLWRDGDDRHEGAQCMAMFLTQFAYKLNITTGEQELEDALVKAIEERWQVQS